jgi:hypothetical protein
MFLRRAPEKYIAGAALDRADLDIAHGRFTVYYFYSVRERTIPTERQPLVGELSANFCG